MKIFFAQSPHSESNQIILPGNPLFKLTPTLTFAIFRRKWHLPGSLDHKAYTNTAESTLDGASVNTWPSPLRGMVSAACIRWSSYDSSLTGLQSFLPSSLDLIPALHIRRDGSGYLSSDVTIWRGSSVGNVSPPFCVPVTWQGWSLAWLWSC